MGYNHYWKVLVRRTTNKLDNYDGGAATTMYRVRTQNRMAVETCQNYHDDTDVNGDVVVQVGRG